MKKKTKKLVTLCLSLVLLLVGYTALDAWKDRQESGTDEPEAEPAIAVTEFSVQDIASYRYENAEYSIGFSLEDDGYVNTDDAAFPVVESEVESQLLAIADLEALQTVTGTDKAEYGLDNPQIKIFVTLEDGSERTFYIGDAALFEDGHYVLDADNDTIFLCSTLLLSNFSVEWSDLVAKEETAKPASDTITFVSIETDGEAVFVASCEEENEHPWQLTTADGTFDADTDAVTEWLAAYSGYAISKTVSYDCKDFSGYGLDPSGTKVTVRYTVTAEDGTQTEETLVFEFASEATEDGTYYTRVNGSAYVYEMTSAYVSELTEYALEDLLYVEEVSEETTEETTDGEAAE